MNISKFNKFLFIVVQKVSLHFIFKCGAKWFNLFETLQLTRCTCAIILPASFNLTGTCTSTPARTCIVTYSAITLFHATAPEIAPILDRYPQFYLDLHLHHFCTCTFVLQPCACDSDVAGVSMQAVSHRTAAAALSRQICQRYALSR